jgi:HlyD family secretion protein
MRRWPLPQEDMSMQGCKPTAGACLLAAILLLPGCRWPWDADDAQLPITLSGTVDAHETDLAFQAPGRIRVLFTDEGRSVRAGDVVAQLDDADLALASRRANAQADSASDALASMRAGARPQELRAARAAVAQGLADQRYANQQVQRTRELIDRQFVSPDQLDRVRSAADAAAARVDQARQSLSRLEEGARRQDLARSAADAEAAAAAAGGATRALGYARLVSPSAGVVSVRLAESGQVVAVGQPVFRLAELQRPWVRAWLPEQDLARVRLGDPADVHVDGRRDKVWHGRLSFISPRAEFTPKTVETRALRVDLVYRVTVDVDDAAGDLKIGMPADVTFRGAAR